MILEERLILNEKGTIVGREIIEVSDDFIMQSWVDIEKDMSTVDKMGFKKYRAKLEALVGVEANE